MNSRDQGYVLAGALPGNARAGGHEVLTLSADRTT